MPMSVLKVPGIAVLVGFGAREPALKLRDRVGYGFESVHLFATGVQDLNNGVR